MFREQYGEYAYWYKDVKGELIHSVSESQLVSPSVSQLNSSFTDATRSFIRFH